MEIAPSKEGILVSQRKYILDLLNETGMLGCRPIDTPMDPNKKMKTSEESAPVDKGRYQRLVEKLIYLSHTRPKIAFSISVRSKKQSVVSRSSAKSEYRALALSICEGMWLQRLLRELGAITENTTRMPSDSQAVISIAKNPVITTGQNTLR
ncbi:uncharacterized mitochondrial protein AtMg00810-like [Ziziphus jujuba]|uniref:Uncharacterized mitochondrial protein AtMg00810-like n=1 Tax=Ziziphus jujuba TaxID=326968 RepID=A0ABM4AAZ8_ZIZJJ|nr:uncharacterized mitochondrial protein AtMg00810-like [Ziziphus jujuba]